MPINTFAWAYGSRVTGESHEASDLDLVLRGRGLEPLGAFTGRSSGTKWFW